MSTNSTKPDVQEIDLLSFSKGIGNAARGINTFIYNCIRFVQRNIILIGIIFIIGAVLGYLLDRNDKGVYDTQIIVAPNFNSTDYLYAKIDQLEAKIKDNDTVFLNKIGIKNVKDLRQIKITPVIDVFRFVSNSGTEQNFRLLELMAQDGDIKKIVAENTTSKNYPYHTITFRTSGRTTDEKTIKPLLAYLNDNDYYRKIQKEYLKNVAIKLRVNDTMVSQIDRLLKEYANESGKSQSVYISENTQLNDVLKTKEKLVSDSGLQRTDLIGLDKVVKDISIITNIKDESGTNGKMKVVLPMFFLFIFLCVALFRSFYKSQKTKYNTTK